MPYERPLRASDSSSCDRLGGHRVVAGQQHLELVDAADPLRHRRVPGAAGRQRPDGRRGGRTCSSRWPARAARTASIWSWPARPCSASRRCTPSATRSSASSRCGSRCPAAATCWSRPTTRRPACRWAPRWSTRPAAWAARAARPAATSASSGSPTRTPTGRRSATCGTGCGAARDPEATPPRIFAGYAHQHLDDDPTYRAALAGRAGAPGRAGRPGHRRARCPPPRSRWTPSPGRHLAVFGLERRRRRGAGRGGAQRRRVTTRRVPPGSSSPRWSPRATSSPRPSPPRSATGRRWPWSTRPAWPRELTVDRPGYRGGVRHGRGRPGARLPTGCGEVLREGPGRGVHLLSWWRGLRRFSEETGGSARPRGRRRPGVPQRARSRTCR